MSEQDIDDIIATSDGDTSWGDDLRGAVTTLKTYNPAALSYIAGEYYCQTGTNGIGTATTTTAGLADRWDMVPFKPEAPLTIDRIGVTVTTGVASATCKVQIYSAHATTGYPDAKIYESGDLDCSVGAPTSVVATTSYSFLAGKLYWLGVRHSSTATLRSLNLAQSRTMGPPSATAANMNNLVRRSLTYTTAATNPYAFVVADFPAPAAPIQIMMRAA